MATKTIPDLPAATSVVAATLFPIVDDPAGTPVTQKATGTQLDAYIRSAGGALTATTLDGSGGALTINTAQADKDVVVSSTGMVNLLFTDAGNNRVGINTATPTVALQVVGTVTATTFSGDGSALTSLPAISTSAYQTVATDPSPLVTATVWYNSTSNTFKAGGANVGAWAAGTSLTTGRNGVAGFGFGTITSVIAAGGDTSGGGQTATTEKWNGSSWSSGGNLSVTRWYSRGSGTASSAIVAGGNSLSSADSYNGTAWSTAGSMSVARYQSGAAGASSTSFLEFGGANGATFLSSSDAYNGSTWTAGGSLPVATMEQGGCGSATAALSVGGETSGGIVGAVYAYNGTTWSTGTSLPAVRGMPALSGTTTSCVSSSGFAATFSSPSAVVYTFDGTTWSTTTSLSTPRSGAAAAGASNTSSFVFTGWGTANTYLSSTEVYTSAPAAKTFTVS